jgi:hypothetical protein
VRSSACCCASLALFFWLISQDQAYDEFHKGFFASECPEFEGIRLFEKLTNG